MYFRDSDRDNAFGFLYVAYGQKYMKESIDSATSLKRAMPEAQIAIVTNEESAKDFSDKLPDVFDRVVQLSPLQADINPKYYGFLNKIRGIRLSPFEYTIFVDSDTYIASSVWEIFQSLNQYDIALAISPQKASIPYKSSEQFLEDFSQKRSFSTALNTGILGFKNTEAINLFLEEWENTYIRKVPPNNEYNPLYSDQTVFCEVLNSSNIRPMILATEYNFRLGLPQNAQGLVKIFHGRPKLGWQRHEELVNSYEAYRIYIPNIALLCMDIKEGCFEIRPYSEKVEPRRVGYGQLGRLLTNLMVD